MPFSPWKPVLSAPIFFRCTLAVPSRARVEGGRGADTESLQHGVGMVVVHQWVGLCNAVAKYDSCWGVLAQFAKLQTG